MHTHLYSCSSFTSLSPAAPDSEHPDSPHTTGAVGVGGKGGGGLGDGLVTAARARAAARARREGGGKAEGGGEGAPMLPDRRRSKPSIPLEYRSPTRVTIYPITARKTHRELSLIPHTFMMGTLSH